MQFFLRHVQVWPWLNFLAVRLQGSVLVETLPLRAPLRTMNHRQPALNARHFTDVEYLGDLLN